MNAGIFWREAQKLVDVDFALLGSTQQELTRGSEDWTMNKRQEARYFVWVILAFDYQS